MQLFPRFLGVSFRKEDDWKEWLEVSPRTKGLAYQKLAAFSYQDQSHPQKRKGYNGIRGKQPHVLNLITPRNRPNNKSPEKTRPDSSHPSGEGSCAASGIAVVSGCAPGARGSAGRR